MNDNEESSRSADSAAWSARESRDWTQRRWRSGGLAIFATASAVALAACGGGTTSPQVASLATTTAADAASSGSNDSVGSSATKPVKGNPTALVDEWATCMHSHGDPDQADPTIDAYGGININIPIDAQSLSGEVHGGADPCNRYMAAAQSALRAADPVAPPPDQTELLKYVNCMRANGVPKYPFPTGNTTNFNGTGVDPNSPFVNNVNKLCGQKLHLPAWWISGTGPPGNVVVTSGSPPDAAVPRGPTTVVPSGNGAPGDSGSGSGG